ncbi:MAG: J domain-containing protein [Planctomycetota bacterium]|jgi:curved DNA-binding protein CbpA
MSASHDRDNYYRLLGVDAGATAAELKRAYRRRVRACHPDLPDSSGDVALFRRVQRAYEVLANPVERDRYDMIHGLGAHAGRLRIYRRSYGRLFESLFSQLRVALQNSVRHTDEAEVKRRAG